jgi:hypothetical protein
MKTFIATTGALALMATSAMAAPGGPAGNQNKTVTLNATVGDFLTITQKQGSTIGDLNVLEGSGDGANNNANNVADGDEKATFTVASNVDYNINLDWATWGGDNPDAPDDSNYTQAYYAHTDGSCAIGGTIHFDEDPTTDGANPPAKPSNGQPDWTVNQDPYSPTDEAVYGIGTEASPDINDCPGDIAKSGTYSLAVDITVSKN